MDEDMLDWGQRQTIYMNRELNKPRKVVTWLCINKQVSEMMVSSLAEVASTSSMISAEDG